MQKHFFKIFLILLGLISVSSAGENLGSFIFHHLGNANEWHYFPLLPGIPLPHHFEIFGINMGITLHVLIMFIAFVLMWVLFGIAGKRKQNAPTSRFGHAVEALVIYIRDDLVQPNLGKKDTAKWLPFFLTMFFFLLTLNILGMIPGFSTVTANINFTAAMAVLVFVVFNLSGMAKNGPVHYFVNLIPKGIPVFVLPILVPIEIIGLFTKAFALAIRLFANMSAGHIIILSLLGLISILESIWVAPASILFSLFISIIEVLVAFLQAYVFTLLSSLFIGMALHQDH